MTRRRRALLACSLAVTAAGLAEGIAWARPGGGGGFRGGSGGGGGGGGGGGELLGALFRLFGFLLRLTIEHPAVGIPIDIVVILVVYFGGRAYLRERERRDWNTTVAPHLQALAAPSRAVRKELLYGVARTDPDFSLVLLEDFLYALYASVHEARGKGQIEQLAAYLKPEVRQRLHAAPAPLAEVRTPIIAALRYIDVKGMNGPMGGFGAPPAAGVELTVEFEANYTEVTRTGAEQTYYARERWTLRRAPGARSRAPDRARTIGCPNCGAPLSSMRGSTCSYCQKVVDTGEFDWVVGSIAQLEKTPQPPTLTSDSEEAGNDLPTIIDPEAHGRLQQLVRRDPTFSWNQLLHRVGLIFSELQPAWSTREWARARPFVSDQLFQMLAYWMETYKRARLRNVNENARITGVELAAVVSDRHYDAITVRLHASGLDYTVTDDGERVSGSKSTPRAYTEYWTLIRGAGTKTRQVADRACPNCGAPLSIAMTGNCTHCNAKVTAGEFDWVLSRIEQDEVYSG